MKTQKRILAILLVLVMTFSFFSCGKPEEETGTTEPVTQTTVPETEKPEKPIFLPEMTAEELLQYSKDKFENFTSYESVQKMEVNCTAEGENIAMTIIMDSTDIMPVYGGENLQKYNARSTMNQNFVLKMQENTVEMTLFEDVFIIDGVLYDSIVSEEGEEKEKFELDEDFLSTVRDIRPIYIMDAFQNYTKTKTDSGFTLTSDVLAENAANHTLENFITIHKDVINKVAITEYEKPQEAKVELYFDQDGNYTGYRVTYRMLEKVKEEEPALFTVSEEGTIVFDIGRELYPVPDDAEDYIPEGQPKLKQYWVSDFTDMGMVAEVHKTAFAISKDTKPLTKEETAKVYDIVKNLKFHYTEKAPRVNVGDPGFYDTLYLTEENAFYYFIDGDMGYLSDPLKEEDKAYMLDLYDRYLKTETEWKTDPFSDKYDWVLSACFDYDGTYYYFSNVLRISSDDVKALNSVFRNADFVKTSQYSLGIGIYRLHSYQDDLSGNSSNNIFYNAETGVFYDLVLHIEFRLTEEEKEKVDSILRFYMPYTEQKFVETATWRLNSHHTETMEIDGEKRTVTTIKTVADNLKQEDMAVLCEIFNAVPFEPTEEGKDKATLSLHMEIKKDGEILQVRELYFDRTYETVLTSSMDKNYIAKLTPEQSETMRLMIEKYAK